MRHYLRCAARVLLGVMILLGAAFAAKHPKDYPETGTITGTGTSGQSAVGGTMVGTGALRTRTVYTHVYKVETDTKTFQLDCGKLPMFSSTGGECGGDKKLQLGDVIHFRVEKSWAYIPVTEMQLDTNTGQKNQISYEQKLRILSEDLKPQAQPSQAAPASAAKP
jgi:hypothetical protein